MDKVFSARVDESVIQQIGLLARELSISKKAVLESAIRQYAASVEAANKLEVFEVTCGSWKRQESPETTVRHSRSAFNQSMTRHHS